MSSFYGHGGAGDGSGGSGEGLAGLTVDGRAVQTEEDKIRFQSDVDRFDYLTVGTRAANSTLGLNSIATGTSNTASGNFSSANGQQTIASQQCAHAEGSNTTASAEYAHAEGYSTTASGTQSHAEGNNSMASGSSSHVEGRDTEASNEAGHAEGYATLSQGNAAHAEGKNTTASGQASHAEGYSTTTGSAGQFAHAEGWNTNASGSAAHAEGYNTSAFGEYSHVQGEGTGAASSSQHVSGRYNILDNNGVYAEIVGNGTGFSADTNFRSNARTLDWNGNAVYTGKVTAGVGPINSMDLTTKLYVDNLITNISGGTTYSVELSQSEVRIPLNFGQVDYWYQGGDIISSTLINTGGSQPVVASNGNVLRASTFNSETGTVTDDPSEPNKTYQNSNLSETRSWIQNFHLLYKTYRGNEIVPGYLQSMRIVYSIHGTPSDFRTFSAPFVKDVFITSSSFRNNLDDTVANEQADGWVGWFSGFAYFVTPEEIQEAIAESSSSSSSEEMVSSVRTDISPFLNGYLYAMERVKQAFLTLELTFNIEGHLVTKILPIRFINNHQPVMIYSEASENYGVSIRPYPNASYYINGQVAALRILPVSWDGDILLPFEVMFDTPFSSHANTIPFDVTNFKLPRGGDDYHIPKWFQLYPGTRYDISYDIMGNMTFASWDRPNAGQK